MKEIIDYKSNDESDYVMLTLHSSELMPGGSPTVKNRKEIKNLYIHMHKIYFKLLPYPIIMPII